VVRLFAGSSPRATLVFFHLTHIPIWEYIIHMARAATTTDVFNALAEPRRREILSFLADSEKPVGEIVVALTTDQPSISKHLGVLREVGLVRVRRVGRHRMYRANADGIRPLYDFAKTFEKYWTHQLLRVKERAEAKEKTNQGEKL
jgi:DNA-binding transcriptional ArsR family regulator